MQQEIVAIALEIVADEFQIVAVGDVTNALGEERLGGFDLFEADRTLLARDFGDAGQFVDQVAGRQTAQGKGEFGAERQAMIIADSGNRISVAANEPPKMMMTAWMS